MAAAFAADADLASVQYRLQVIDGDGRSTGTTRPRRSGALPSGDLAAHVIRFRAYHWQPTTGNAYAASALARIMPVPESAYRIEADAFLAELIPFCGPMRGLDDVLGDYRVHGANNYRGTKADAAFFRRKIQRIHEGHALVVERAPGLGLGPRALVAARGARRPFIGFRLASLRLDPEDHPVAPTGGSSSACGAPTARSRTASSGA